MLAQGRDPSDDENRGTPIARLLDHAGDLANRPDRRRLRGQCAVTDERGRVLRRTAVREERIQDVRKLIGARVADDGAIQP